MPKSPFMKNVYIGVGAGVGMGFKKNMFFHLNSIVVFASLI